MYADPASHRHHAVDSARIADRRIGAAAAEDASPLAQLPNVYGIDNSGGDLAAHATTHALLKRFTQNNGSRGRKSGVNGPESLPRTFQNHFKID